MTFILVAGVYGKLEDKFCQIKVLNFFRVVPKRRKVPIKKSRGLIFFNPPSYRKTIFYIADMLFLGALFYGIYLYTPLVSALYKYKVSEFNNTTTNDLPIFQEEIGTTKPVETKKSNDYLIEIPKILAASKVIENVSPFDKVEYTRVLKNNVVAQVKGSAVPGSGKGSLIYIFAHSSNESVGMVRNNAVFYLLGELQNNDLIYLNYHGTELKYRVYDKKIVLASDLNYLSYHDQEKEVVILQTCWPIGTDWKRLLVFAELIP